MPRCNPIGGIVTGADSVQPNVEGYRQPEHGGDAEQAPNVERPRAIVALAPTLRQRQR
jgi:hypothetical protein